jgi:hypothetical protein
VPIPTLPPHRGTLILVFGILGLVVCFPFGIAAWIMGSGDLKKMAAGQMDPTGEGLTRAGVICGIINVVLLCISLLAAVVLIALGVFAAAAGA